MWFGRSRVQDRSEASDDLTPRQSGQQQPGKPQPGPPAGAPSRPAGPRSVSASAIDPNSFGAIERQVDALDRTAPIAPDGPSDSGYAIDALRAATTAAGAREESARARPAPDYIAEVRRLHEASLEAASKSRRLSRSRARRLQDALADEAQALRALGFDSFEAFAAVYGATPEQDNSETESDETVMRICALLLELGIDPGNDPLQAASVFLTTHEDALEAVDIVMTPPAEVVRPTTIASPADFAEITAREPAVSEPRIIEPVVVEPEIIEAAAIAPEVTALENIEPAAIAPEVSEREIIEPDPIQVIDEAHELDQAVEPDAPWIPAAQIPTGQIPNTPRPVERPADDDVVDRWIHAEARAERMHAEVDRAQAELVAMLARSADLEHNVETRVDELDNAQTELEHVRGRVVELEQSIAQLKQAKAGSDTERDDLERSLAASRERVAELEAALVEREHAFTQATSDRASALATVAELEATLAARTFELEQARTSVAELETELTAQAARLDHTRVELGAARTNAEELGTELENTRRSLDALDAHAEAIEAELADARRAADSPDTRRELEAVRQELASAREELGSIEAQHAVTDRALTSDRFELQQLERNLVTHREEAASTNEELIAARRAVDETLARLDETQAQLEAAERARDAVTIDAADLLARAEAEAAELLERANRDAESIRQEAAYTSGNTRYFEDETLRNLVVQVERLERKVAKQRRRLDRLARTGRGGAETVDVAARLKAARPAANHAPTARPAVLGSRATADVIASAELEAAEIRRAARRDRDRFRAELASLLDRLAPADDDYEDDDD
jgi:predicted  nucleic acid-binding Zn-ribbon protein